MIIGIGSDIVDIRRIHKVFTRFPKHFLSRCFHQKEIEKFHALLPAKQIPFLAKRFAAKEALSKAFGTGFSDGLQMRQIAILNDSKGKPIAHFDEESIALLTKSSLFPDKIHLSLSDEINYAMAFAVLEKTTQDRQ